MASRSAVPVAGLLLALLAGCGAGPVDRADLESAVAVTFDNLYGVQQQRIGRSGAHDAGASASCDKGGPTVADEGTGEDWSCLVTFVSGDGSLSQVAYELQVKTDACYRASGPASAIIGTPRLTTPQGDVDNPLIEFDGCTRAR